MALLKLYRGLAAPALEVGKIWFDSANQVIKVCTTTTPAEGTDGWEPYGLSEAEIAALILAAKNEVLGTLEADDAATLKALNEEIDDLQAELAALAAKTVTINEKTTGHVKVEKTVDAQGATVYTVTEEDIASAKGLADEIKRAGDEEARIAGLVATEQGRATAAEEALAGRLDVIEGEAEGSIKKAVADAKAELIGDATEAGNTLGKLEDRIEDIVKDAKTYSIAKVESGLGENVKEAFKLVDEDGTQVGETINIYKDSSLISVELVDEKPAETEGAEATKGQFIKYTYVLANGAESVQYVDVSRLLVEAEFKNGLEVSAAGEVSVKVDAASEAFLTVGTDGVKLAGVQDAIDAAEDAANKYTDGKIAALNADVTSAATYTVTDEEGVESTVDHKVRVQVVEENGVITGVNVTESDIASAKTVKEHEIVVSAALNDLNARMTTAEGSVADHDTRLAQAEADIDALEAWKEGLNTGVMSVTGDESNAYVKVVADPTTGDVALGVTVASVDAANGGAAGLATDAYVREQIAAAAMVWEDGSF